MTDDIDRAQQREQQFQAECQRAQARRAAQNTLRATGFCHYCHDTVDSGLRFCHAECRDGFEHEQKLKRMAGVR